MKQWVILFLGIWIVVSGCESRPPPKFKVGEMVRSTLSKEPGQVVYVSAYGYETGYRYNVRFQAGQTYTDTHLLREDGPVEMRPLTLVENMTEFELEELPVGVQGLHFNKKR
jgi:hypothetical protein